jgi:hypothetical protein
MRWLNQLFSCPRRYDELSETICEHLEEKIADLINDGLAVRPFAGIPPPSPVAHSSAENAVFVSLFPMVGVLCARRVLLATHLLIEI